MIIVKKLESLRRALWIWRQPLVRQPNWPSAPISDLFIWRSTSEWETFFELIDIPSLFEDKHEFGYIILVFFNINGNQFLKKKIDLQPNRRQLLNISKLIGRKDGDIGTFAIFHSRTPSIISNLGSFIAERGYISYCYLGAPLKSYVHGNHDAITIDNKGCTQLIGGCSFLKRSYNLQHEINPEIYYEYALVNSTPNYQYFTCKLISVKSGSVLNSKFMKVAPGGVLLDSIATTYKESIRLIIESRLVMARPIIFRLQNFKLDVFHG